MKTKKVWLYTGSSSPAKQPYDIAEGAFERKHLPGVVAVIATVEQSERWLAALRDFAAAQQEMEAFYEWQLRENAKKAAQ